MSGAAASLVFARLDLREAAAREDATEAAVRLLRDHGIGGFVLFGGDVASVRAAVARVRAAAKATGRPPPIVTSDLERGAGQQVEGATRLPPARALGAADDVALARAAGAATAREARALGIDVVLAPVLDLAHPVAGPSPVNPIVGIRSFGPDPEPVARLGAAFIEGIQGEGALACAKHFPGHGATTGDSHLGLPRDARPRAEIERADLVPFRAAVEAGVGSVMTAHVSYPDLGTSAATFEPAIVGRLLRERLGHEGLVMTDALDMGGALDDSDGDDTLAARRALLAGADVLLHPRDPASLVAALAMLVETDAELARAVAAARARLDAARARLGARDALPAWLEPSELAEHAATGERIARAAIGLDDPPALPLTDAVIVALDDDDDPGVGRELARSARELGARVDVFDLKVGDEAARREETLREATERSAGRPLLVAVFCAVRGYKGRADLHEDLAAAARALLAREGALLAVFGDPGIAAGIHARLGRRPSTLRAHGLDPACERAAAHALFAPR